MIDRLKQSYPFPSLFKRLRMSIFVSLFIFLFLYILEPFDLNQIDTDYKTIRIAGYGMVSFACLLLFYVLPPKILISIFDDTRWTLSKELLWLLSIVITIGLFLSIYESLLCIRPLSFFAVFETVGKALIIGIIPITVVTMLNQNVQLRENLKRAKDAAINLKNIQQNKVQKPGIITVQSDISETLSFNPNDFLLAQAEDNYTTFFLEQEGKIKNVLLRITLKNSEKQLHFSFIQRCHRSYIINLLKIETINGNANGYKIQLTNFEKEIPVSRQNSKSILQAIAKLAE